MAISGRFEADFASFYEAVRQAQVSLKGFESSNKDVERSVNEMVESFSGRKVISEATLMTDAVRRLGSPARLTTKELQAVSATAQEAIEKMNRLGQEAPPHMVRLANASRGARIDIAGAANSVRQFDDTLKVLGINLGPVPKALDEISRYAGMSAKDLGALGVAGAAVGSAIGGWQIGRAISEFAGLDEKIGDVVLSLQGLPTVAEQAAAATADAIAKAQKAHPELKVLTGDTARLLNELDAKAQVAANEEAARVADRVSAVSRVAAEIKKVMDEVNAVKNSGVWPELTGQINSHTVSLSALAKEYHVTDEAMNILARDAARLGDIERNNTEKLATLRQQQHDAEVNREKKKAEEEQARLKALYEGIDAQTKANEAQHEKDTALLEQQIRARQEVERTTLALEAERWAAMRAADAAKTFSQEYDLSTAEGRARFMQANPMGNISSAATDEYFKTHDLADAVRDGLVSFYGGASGSPGLPPPPPRGSSSAASGSGFSQAPGGALPALPSAGLAGGVGIRPAGVPQIYAPVFVSGVFDPSSAHALSRTVADGMYRTLLQARKIKAG